MSGRTGGIKALAGVLFLPLLGYRAVALRFGNDGGDDDQQHVDIVNLLEDITLKLDRLEDKVDNLESKVCNLETQVLSLIHI